MIDTFTYLVKKFDPSRLQVEVDFGADGWAIVPLSHPLPKNRLELEKKIALYAPAKEVAVARAKVADPKDDTNVDYIQEMVGKQFEAARHTFEPTPQPNLTPVIDVSNHEQILIDLEKQALWELVDERLLALGIMK